MLKLVSRYFERGSVRENSMLYLLKSKRELGDAFWRGSVGLEGAAWRSMTICACEERW
jgi:hypothetical protein